MIDPSQTTEYQRAGIQLLERCNFTNYELIEEGSEFALPTLLEAFEGHFDMAFIDGWHTFDHTLLDLYYCLRLVRVGGIIVVDDCRMPPVAKAVAYVEAMPSMMVYRRSRSRGAGLKRASANLLNKILWERLRLLLPAFLYEKLYPKSQCLP